MITKMIKIKIMRNIWGGNDVAVGGWLVRRGGQQSFHVGNGFGD